MTAQASNEPPNAIVQLPKPALSLTKRPSLTKLSLKKLSLTKPALSPSCKIRRMRLKQIGIDL
jgi:hypothetical protein